MKTNLKYLKIKSSRALFLTFGLSVLNPGMIQAQEEAMKTTAPPMSTEELILISLVGFTIFVSILVLITVMYTLLVMRQIILEEAKDEPVESLWASLDKDLLTKAVPIEREKDILLDHNYDGIRELDNHLPPWWVYLFYGTVVFAIIYMFNYHVLELSPLPKEEYQQSMAQAAIEVEAYKKTLANNIDESNVVYVKDDAQALEVGKKLFVENCVQCHGANLEGGTGPNLTDEFWLHGASIQDVFKTIKYGVTKKGMIAWEKKLKPDEMQNVASYILSLQGSKPDNAKKAQGEAYVMEEDGSAEMKK